MEHKRTIRLQRAIDWIEDHLSEEIGIGQAADVAGLSPFHFSRLFRAVTGFSVMEYVRGRRLTEAARRMRRREAALIDIALDSGFGSQQAFTRAFTAAFGIAPGMMINGEPLKRGFVNALDLSRLEWMMREAQEMEPVFNKLDAFELIGLRRQFKRETLHEIPDLWRSLRPEVRELDDWQQRDCFGVCVQHADEDGGIDYFAGVERIDGDEPTASMVSLNIPAQNYAVFVHKITRPELGPDIRASYSYIFGTWFPQSDYKLAKGYDFELYSERFDPSTLSGEIDLYIPVVPKSD